MATNPTDKSVASQLPEEIIAFVLAVGSDRKINTNDPEIRELLPSAEVIRAVLADAGLAPASQTSDLDQAQAWVEEQRSWQDRAVKVQKELQEKFPFTKEAAMKGEIPSWATEPWATRLLYQWSAGLQESVLEAETFLLNK
jgi:hypothetical protein